MRKRSASECLQARPAFEPQGQGPWRLIRAEPVVGGGGCRCTRRLLRAEAADEVERAAASARGEPVGLFVFVAAV